MDTAAGFPEDTIGEGVFHPGLLWKKLKTVCVQGGAGSIDQFCQRNTFVPQEVGGQNVGAFMESAKQ